MVGDRKDQTLREFAIVLLSNLSEADCVAARAIALQKGAIANLIGFLEVSFHRSQFEIMTSQKFNETHRTKPVERPSRQGWGPSAS